MTVLFEYHASLRTEGRICKSCQILRRKDEFHNEQRAKEGKRATCKFCTRYSQNQKRKVNPERVRAIKRASYWKNIEANRASQRRRRASNPEAFSAAQKLRRLEQGGEHGYHTLLLARGAALRSRLKRYHGIALTSGSHIFKSAAYRKAYKVWQANNFHRDYSVHLYPDKEAEHGLRVVTGYKTIKRLSHYGTQAYDQKYSS